MLRLMTITVRPLSTSRMGMPKMGLEASVRAGRHLLSVLLLQFSTRKVARSHEHWAER
jgi:hypothetical protein